MSNNMDNNKESEWKQRERGALWKKEGKNQNYLTGVIKSLDNMGQQVKSKVIVFANKNKTSENAPDFIIYDSKEKKRLATKLDKFLKQEKEFFASKRKFSAEVQELNQKLKLQQ